MDKTLHAQTTHSAMGTVMTHRAFGARAQESLAAVRAEIARQEARLSRFLPDSEISRVNGSAGVRRETVSPETYDLLSKAAAYARRLPGTFDVTIAPLVDLWRAAKASLAAPDPERIEQVLPLVNSRDLVLHRWTSSAGLRARGQSVDLGGIGKGLAGDKVVEVLRASGISSACSNLGGNVVTLGAKPDGSPWQVGIQHPRQDRALMGSVGVVDQTVVTSGDYQRCFVDRRGQRHHHILDPRTGHPSRSGLISVTVVADESMLADVLSTSVFVAGMDRGREILNRFPQAEAVLVDAELRAYVTRGLSARFGAAKEIQVKILN